MIPVDQDRINTFNEQEYAVNIGCWVGIWSNTYVLIYLNLMGKVNTYYLIPEFYVNIKLLHYSSTSEELLGNFQYCTIFVTTLPLFLRIFLVKQYFWYGKRTPSNNLKPKPEYSSTSS